jgi:putative inorganic carbon (HCO3(-)) transporter
VAKTRDVKTIILFSLVGLGLEITLASCQFIFKSSFGLTALGMRDEATIFDLGTQYIHRVSGTLGNANSLGWYFNFLLPIPLALLFYKTHIKYRILVFILALSGILALFFTFSRASWFCFLLSVAIVISLLLIHASLKKKVYITILVALLAILLGIGFLITDNPVKERFLQDDRGSAYTRIPLMQVAFTMIKAHPLIGVGLNNYTLVHQEYDETTDNITYYFPHTVHNVYLLLAAEIGIPGLLFFLMLTIHIIKRALKYIYNSSGYIKYVLIGIIAGLVGFLLHGLVDSGTIATYKFLPYWFYCGLVLEITHHIHDVKRW